MSEFFKYYFLYLILNLLNSNRRIHNNQLFQQIKLSLNQSIIILIDIYLQFD